MRKIDIWRDYQIFATLTYSRDESLRNRWLSVQTDTNRLIQRFARANKGSYLEYLRAIEPHKDGYPHVHLHIRFGTDFKVGDRDKYIRNYVRSQLKELAGDSGFTNTDFQRPKHDGMATIGYILKYLSKNKGASRLWQLILSPTNVMEPQVSELGYPIKIERYASWKLLSMPKEQTLLWSSLTWKKIKLLTWSRGYPSTFC